MKVSIKVYSSADKELWDTFVRSSKNGTFLFCRDFMDYHSHRFNDRSFLFYSEKGKLIALMPGHITNDAYYTHRGLTYGGLIMGNTLTMLQVLHIFDELLTHLDKKGIKELIYKSIPHIYHRQPAEEDLYALFRNGAALIERNISSAIDLSDKIAYSDFRKRGVFKAKKNKISVQISDQLADFWDILTTNLKEKYNTNPVHSLEEIELLKSRFTNEVKLFCANNEWGDMVAGCIVFDTKKALHVQYIASTIEGKEKSSVDLLIDAILNSSNSDHRFFDYGVSTENEGLLLNENLIRHKEGFGARGIMYDTYSIKI